MIAMSHYLAMDVETVSYLRGRLEDALELECADYQCEGTGSIGCMTMCALEKRIWNLRVKIAKLTEF